MEGGTTFHFVTEGLRRGAGHGRARPPATADVAIAGGAAHPQRRTSPPATIDELRLHVVPFTVGTGLRVFDGVDDLAMTPVSSRTTPYVTHLVHRHARHA